jgi:hypothetical protein
MLVVGFMSAGCSLLKHAETKYAFTQFSFTRMTPSSLSLEPIGCFVPCVSGIKSPRIGVFARLLLESDKWARVSVGSVSTSTSPWVLSLWPLKRLLELFTYWTTSSLGPQSLSTNTAVLLGFWNICSYLWAATGPSCITFMDETSMMDLVVDL